MRLHARRFSVRVAAVLGTAVLAFLPSAGSASANTSRANTDTFSASDLYAFPDNYICIKYTRSATITYNAVRYGPTAITNMVDYWVEKIVVSHITATYSMVRYDSVSHACTSAGVTWKRLEAGQHWSGYSCSFNPSIAVQVPFAVGVGFWPSCGNRNQGSWRSTYDSANGLDGPTQTQSTTSTIRFGNHELVYQPAYVRAPTSGGCYGTYITMHWYLSGADTSHNFGTKANCLTPVW